MSFNKKILALQHDEEQIGFKRDEQLRRAGWEQTCSTPGSLWLWRKELGGKTYLVNQGTAIWIQQWLEEYGEPAAQSSADRKDTV